ncbi:hypothetical protein CCACVL1_27116, partial [Corchorus capsularis]
GLVRKKPPGSERKKEVLSRVEKQRL